MTLAGIIGNNTLWKPLPLIVASDSPETGGIGGNIKPDKPKGPWVCEERPTTTDPKTGERIYIDQIELPGAIHKKSWFM